MSSEFIKQDLVKKYAHLWRILTSLVQEFPEEAWTKNGHGRTTPDQLALHTILSTQFYMKDEKEKITLASGRIIEPGIELLREVLPGKDDLLALIPQIAQESEKWLLALDLEAKVEDFPWAGEINFGVAIFLHEHNLYHLGEISALLNEELKGKSSDHFAGTL